VRYEHTLLYCSFVHPDLVVRLRNLGLSVDIIYEPDLMPHPRYAADHVGGRLRRSESDEAYWRSLLQRADILFDVDRLNLQELPDLAPNVRWIQFTSAGIGGLVARHEYRKRWPNAVFTTAAGIHAQPLTEFALMGILSFSRGLLPAMELQREKHWERFAGTDVLGRTLLIFGAGAIGRRLAVSARSLGLKVLGIKRRTEGVDAAALGFDELHPPERLNELLPRADYLVLSAPHTPDTEHVIGERQLALLPEGAVIVNIGRGALIDEPALIAALGSGHLGGAALDVFETEPLPERSPLWDMPNVIVFPHSGSTSDRENSRLTDLFIENLQRFVAGEPMVNVFDPSGGY
jgi:phosphoglycerate dehydrogenase-like enzyme